MVHTPQAVADLAPPETLSRRPWIGLAVICLAQFMLIADLTVVNVALPAIARDLDLAHGSLTWALAAYSTAFGGLMILGGRLADLYGRRRMFLTGLIAFILASAVSGMATNAPMLITGRAAQGAAAAMMSPAALSLATTMFTGAARAKALGVWSAIGGSGAAVGVLLGGVLTFYVSWRWIFFVNIPVGVLVVATVPALIAASEPNRWMVLDVRGAIAVTTSAAAAVFAFTRVGDAGWADAGAITALAIGAAAGIAFALIERSAASPLIPLGILRRRSTASGLALMLVASGLLLAGFFLSSLFTQQVRGLSPVGAGLLFVPVAVAIAAGVHGGSHILRHAGPRAAAITGLILAAAGAGILSTLDADSSAAGQLLPGFLVMGAGLGVVIIAATTTALGGANRAEAGALSGIVNTGHELGGALGVGIVAAVAGASVTGPARPGGAWPADGFATAYAVCAVIAAVAAGFTILVVRRGRVELPDGAMPIH
jgi:EmrB/QacA subfamily drug resistance transporter